MMGRTVTIGGAATTVIAGTILRVQGVVTDIMIGFALVILGLALMSLVISWGATEAYKRLLVLDDWGSPAGRRKIYAAALVSGSVSMLLCGVVFLVLVEFTWRAAVVIAVLWLLGSLMVGLSSPWLWSVTFERILPRVYQCLGSKGPAQ